MLNYSLSGGLPPGSRALWSQRTLWPLSGRLLTPFSSSVLVEIAGRAWYRYYDRLGFNPTPRARVVRHHLGRVYFNLSLSAQREAEAAGVEPITFMVDGVAFPACKVEKAGLLAGLRASMNARRMGRVLREMTEEIGELLVKTQAWWARVRELRWTQAEILQIMEEIEPLGAEAFTYFIAARQAMEIAHNRLLRAASAKDGAAPSLEISQFGIPHESAEYEIARQLADFPRPTPAVVAWLQTGQGENWRDEMPESPIKAALISFLERYGCYTAQPAELRQPRWQEDPSTLLRLVETKKGELAQLVSTADMQGQMELHAGQAQEAIQQMRILAPLQSRALAGLLYLLAGTRRWVLAAAREAMTDERILEQDDVFFFEIEEIKQMMTGEWNISDRGDIRATASRRRAQFAEWSRISVPELLIGDAPAISLDRFSAPPGLGLWALDGAAPAWGASEETE